MTSSISSYETEVVNNKTSSHGKISGGGGGGGISDAVKTVQSHLQKIDRDSHDAKLQLSHVSNLCKVLLQKNNVGLNAYDISVGVMAVELIKKYSNRDIPQKEKMMEKCSQLLHITSIVDPSFKKGVARLFKIMEEFPENPHILKESSAAIGNIVVANPDACARIAPSVPTVIASLRRFPDETSLLQYGLKILAFAYAGPLKPSFVQKGGLETTISIIKHHFTNADVQGMAMETIAQFSQNARSTEEKLLHENLVPHMRLLLRSMKQHSDHIQVSKAGCNIVRNVLQLPQHKSQLLVLDTLLLAIQKHGTLDETLMDHACAALNILLEEKSSSTSPSSSSLLSSSATSTTTALSASTEKTGIKKASASAAAAVSVKSLRKSANSPATKNSSGSSSSSSSKQQLSQAPSQYSALATAVLEGMKHHASSAEVQTQGLRLLLSLTIQPRQQARDAKEFIDYTVSDGSVDVILQAMTIHKDSVSIAKASCEILKHISRASIDFQRAIVAKNGILTILACMRRHISSLAIQDASMATMRNLCANKDNRPQIALEGGISTLIVTMTVFKSDAAIQAYGYDALGRLATNEENRIAIFAENGVIMAMDAMKGHSNHIGVQDRACFFLLNMTEHQPVVQAMHEAELLPLLLETKVPAKKEATDRLDLLIARIEKVNQKGGLGWFNRLTGKE